MEAKNWHGIMKILEVRRINTQGNIVWKKTGILNMLHNDGEEFILKAAFTGGQDSTIIPENYYLGMDNRSAIAADDTMDDITGEPSGGGYARQEIASTGDFSVSSNDTHFVVTSPVLAFRSTTEAWGPVSTIFLTDKDDDTGYLIATAELDDEVSLDPGEVVTVRLAMQLKDVPS